MPLVIQYSRENYLAILAMLGTGVPAMVSDGPGTGTESLWVYPLPRYRRRNLNGGHV